ncbi:hypothetical protein IFM12275_40580 [Nocardia sputorum]|uniref:hypothetical protein n=1 Tax=Nocardia sputorum TaxID=2984338 RepID=UPI00248FC144|nr:hypothetical protein [Nocardia sputorum]BDT94082.1 hypothetical protein IFM12275_40580 [Nocardia sputorum]
MKIRATTAAILAILATLGVLLLLDNWHPIRAAGYLAVWSITAALLICHDRRRNHA